jgi:hypothetical protein
MAGDESQDYTDDPNNMHVFAINTICNYDKDIIPFIHSKIGSAYIRIDEENFELDDGSKPIFITKQDRK